MTNAATTPAPAFADCPYCTECGISLKKDGTFVKHGAEYTGYKGKRCPANGKTPTEAEAIRAAKRAAQ